MFSSLLYTKSARNAPVSCGFLKKIDFLINQSGLNCLKRANIRYLIPKKCSFLYFSVKNIRGCDKADLKNRLCQQPGTIFYLVLLFFSIVVIVMVKMFFILIVIFYCYKRYFYINSDY